MFLTNLFKKKKDTKVVGTPVTEEKKEIINESAFQAPPEVELDYTDADDGKSELFDANARSMHVRYQTGDIPKINRSEYEVLKFCHNRNMKDFLREEFEKHPIVLDENGGLVGENPFEKERREKALREAQELNQ